MKERDMELDKWTKRRDREKDGDIWKVRERDVIERHREIHRKRIHIYRVSEINRRENI